MANRWMCAAGNVREKLSRLLTVSALWCLGTVCGVLRVVNPLLLSQRWQYRRYGNRYTVDPTGSVIYRPTLYTKLSKYIDRDAPEQRKLLAWVQHEIPEFKMTDFGPCWSDGIALCALLEAQCPGACPRYDLLRSSHKINNCRLALKTAYKHLNIPLNVISAEDLATFSNQYQASIQQLISFIKWSSTQKAVKEMNKVEHTDPGDTSTKQTPQHIQIKSCFASGCGLAVGLAARRCRFYVQVPPSEALDLFIAIRGPSGITSHEHITMLFPRQRSNSTERAARDRRAVSLWKYGAAKVLTASGRRAVNSKRFGCPSISEESKIAIEYYVIKEGLLAISYVPLNEGTHTMILKWNNRMFLDSPYQIRVSGTIDNLNKMDHPPSCSLPCRFDKLKYNLAYMSMATYDPMEESKAEKEKSQEMNRCGVAAAVLNRTSKVQRSISRIGVPASGSLPKQAVVTKRRVLKRVITTGGQEIVIQEAAPTPPHTTPEVSLDNDVKDVTPSSDLKSRGISLSDDTKSSERDPATSDSPPRSSINDQNAAEIRITGSRETSDSSSCLTIPTQMRALQLSPFSTNLDAPVLSDKVRELSVDDTPINERTPESHEEDYPFTKYNVTPVSAKKSSDDGPVIDSITKRQSRHSISGNRPMLNKSESKRMLRTSFSLPSLCRRWNAFDIDADDTLTVAEMESLSIAAQTRQKRATVSVVELNNMLSDFNSAMNESKVNCKSEESQPRVTSHQKERPVESPPKEASASNGSLIESPSTVRENTSSPTQIIGTTTPPVEKRCPARLRKSNSIESLRSNLSSNVRVPKATKDKWTQVNYETITSETGWKRPTTYVRPRRRPIYLDQKAPLPGCESAGVQQSVSGGPTWHTTAEENNRHTANQISQTNPAPDLNTPNGSGESARENQGATPSPSHSQAIRPNRFPSAFQRPKYINGHRALERFLYRGKIPLDPKLTSNGILTPTPVDEKIAFASPVRRYLRNINSGSSSEGRRSTLPSSRDVTPDGESRIHQRLRHRNMLRKKVMFSKRVLIFKRSSSRSSRTSKQSNESTRQLQSRQVTASSSGEKVSQDDQDKSSSFEPSISSPWTTHPSYGPSHASIANTLLSVVGALSHSAVAQVDSTTEAKSHDSLDNHAGYTASNSTGNLSQPLGDDSYSANHAASKTDTRAPIRRQLMSTPAPPVQDKGATQIRRHTRSHSYPQRIGSLTKELQTSCVDFLPVQEAPSRVAEYIQNLADDDGSTDRQRNSNSQSSPDENEVLDHRKYVGQVSAIGTSIDNVFIGQDEGLDVPTHFSLDPIQETSNVPDPFKCRAFGAGLSHGVVGSSSIFQVSAPTVHNGSLCVSVTGPRPRTVRETSVVFTGDDLYEVTFEGSRPGVYLINIKWCDTHIPNSPFVCQITF